MSAPTLFEYAPKSSAALSPDGIYRYSLLRTWRRDGPLDLWVMLNPSTADAAMGRVICAWRCIGFSKSWGGAHGEPGRIAQVVALLRGEGRRPLALGVTQGGQPRHPLYLRGDAGPQIRSSGRPVASANVREWFA